MYINWRSFVFFMTILFDSVCFYSQNVSKSFTIEYIYKLIFLEALILYIYKINLIF